MVVPLAVMSGWIPSSAAAQPVAVVNETPSFPPGAYTALHVDPFDSRRLAVGTRSGIVAWTDDGTHGVHETRALSPRRYDAMALRGTGSQAFIGGLGESGPGGGGGDDDEEEVPTGSDLEQAGAGEGAFTSPQERALRLFIQALRDGRKFPRWKFWMIVGQPFTDVTDLAMPSGEGRMLAASSMGALQSDPGRRVWSKVLGTPGQMPREQDLAVFSVTVNPEDPSHVLAGTSQGLKVSHDGGFTFREHPDPRMAEEYVLDFRWDRAQQGLVLAITYNAVLQSFDSGKTFELGFASEGDVFDVALSDQGAYVATSEGLVIVGQRGQEKRLLESEMVLGVTIIDQGVLLVTQTELILLSKQGRFRLARTTPGDPFIGVRGGPRIAWAATNHAIFRIGGESLQRRNNPDPPRLALSAIELEEAVKEHLNLGPPEDTRFHNRWYAMLVPEVSVDVFGWRSRRHSTMFDGTFPVRFRRASATSKADLDYQVMAKWDLSELVFGDHNVVYPHLILESQVRNMRKTILENVQRRYREASNLVHMLRRPPNDVRRRLSWQMRLQEHAAYLEAMAGREVIRGEAP